MNKLAVVIIIISLAALVVLLVEANHRDRHQ